MVKDEIPLIALREAIYAREFTLRSFAREMGWHESKLGHVLAGRKPILESDWARASEILRVPLGRIRPREFRRRRARGRRPGYLAA